MRQDDNSGFQRCMNQLTEN